MGNNSNTLLPSIGELKAAARRRWWEGVMVRFAEEANAAPAFIESQNLVGYAAAFNAWQNAIWRWIDSYAKTGDEERWRERLPAAFTFKNKEEAEFVLQGWMARRAMFLDGLIKQQQESDVAHFKSHGQDFSLAQMLDDDRIFEELASLCSRKTSQNKKRGCSLDFLIRLWWVPGCFWAITNHGIGEHIYKVKKLRYNERLISNAITKLGLRRPSSPLYRGLDVGGKFIPR